MMVDRACGLLNDVQSGAAIRNLYPRSTLEPTRGDRMQVRGGGEL
jgi:hypothetical protein